MPGKPKWPWITLLVLQSIQLLSLLHWLVMAGLSFMAFDQPGSAEMWQPWAFVLAIWSYPIWLLLAGIVSWILFRFGRNVAAVVLSAVFTLRLLAILLLLFIGNS
jgi:hypothetical protein